LLNDESSPPLRTQESNQEVTEEVLERTTQETTQEDGQENLLQNAQPAEIEESTPQAAHPSTQESSTEAREDDTQENIQRDLYEDLNESLSESGAESRASIHERTPPGTMGTAQESTQVLLEEPTQPRLTEQLETTNPHKKTRKQKYFSGRTVSLRFFAACVFLALVLNITLLGYTAGRGQSYGNIWTIYEGNCGYIKWLDRGLHLVINVLGIIILAAVGAFLILLSSPTREDLNSVHEHGKWLEIGIPSFRNFFQVTGTQKALLITLFLASLPLHILYVYARFPQGETLILFLRYNSIMFVQISSTWFTLDACHCGLLGWR
jgi:hypothetical protein